MRIHCLQHVPFEDPAGIADWATKHAHTVATTLLFETTLLPNQEAFDWLVVLGGLMGVYDDKDYSWLTAEKDFLRESIAARKTIVGICLGAQLLADALGARVRRNPHKEIGWFPLELSEEGRHYGPMSFLPRRFDVFHWHGDTFELPAGARHLAWSAGCEHQAFLFDDRVLGLQFHLESTPSSVRDLVANCPDEIVPDVYVQTAERMLEGTPEDYRRIHQALFGILQRLPGR